MQPANPTTPLIAALFGMEERFQKNLTFYLKGPCRGIAVIGSEQIADVDIIDGDVSNAAELLANRQQATAHRPILILTLNPKESDDRVFYLAKPVQVEAMVEQLQRIRQHLSPQNASATVKPTPTLDAETASNEISGAEDSIAVRSESEKTAKHTPAPVLNEKSFHAFVGTIGTLNSDDTSAEPINVTRHFLACVRTAYKSACEEGQIVKLNSAWKPLIIFPKSNEVWLDSDDNQLRAFANLSLNKMAGRTITLTPMDPAQTQQLSLDKYLDMHSFIWKLAIWTSKGRYISSIEIDKPVYLKHWPNFTRLVVTPYALRITALLITGQYLPNEISEKLNIQPQYVHVFLSACCSIGLLGQNRDYQPPHKAKISSESASKKQSLFNKILSKLRGG